jgi:hypothetical protein
MMLEEATYLGRRRRGVEPLRIVVMSQHGRQNARRIVARPTRSPSRPSASWWRLSRFGCRQQHSVGGMHVPAGDAERLVPEQRGNGRLVVAEIGQIFA